MTAQVCGATCRDGHPCQKPPMMGQARCRLHGGRSPQAMAKGAQRAAEGRLRAEVARMAAQPITDPVRWLQDVGGEIAQWLTLCRAGLERVTGAEQSEAIVRLYERALGRALDAADRMARLGITTDFLAAHETRLGEEQARQFIDLLESVVRRLELTEEQTARVPDALAAAIDELND